MDSPDPFARAQHALRARIFWATLCVATLLVLLLSRALTPAPLGLGTHEQLGLPRCAFLALTSLPCPACGLTTSFAHTARLSLFEALQAHILGVPLFALIALAFGFSIAACARAWSVPAVARRLRVAQGLAILCVLALLSWLVRIAGEVINR